MGEVTATVVEDPWIVNGQLDPSHLGLAVECDMPIAGLKGFLHEVVDTWFTQAAEYITKRGYATTVFRDGTTGRTSLDGTGWSLYVVFTSEKSYVTHITLGRLKTGNPTFDANMARMSDSCPDNIEPRFAAPNGEAVSQPIVHDKAYRVRHAVERYNRVAGDIPNNTLPLSLDAGNSPEQHITPKFVRDVWGKYELDRIRPTIKNLLSSGDGEEDLYKGGFVVKMARIRSDVMDFFRLPNFTSEL
ncbi:hypothetical protein HPB51_020080 [Rhipicephalus microplus]|uniref:Uncharacterized protein n=1 Tax=Rhipicephalus microplus TaxID=6941 RepID=A0A9J6ECA2_RHIMP|nr:hypothetical protein HPB51_020080 [Rhipicephalus microplus]